MLGANPAKLEKTKLILVTADVLSLGPAPAPGRAPTIHFKPGTLKLLMYQLANERWRKRLSSAETAEALVRAFGE